MVEDFLNRDVWGSGTRREGGGLLGAWLHCLLAMGFPKTRRATVISASPKAARRRRPASMNHSASPSLGSFFRADKSLFSAHAQSTPFVRPPIPDLVATVEAALDKNYPPTGTV